MKNTFIYSKQTIEIELHRDGNRITVEGAGKTSTATLSHWAPPDLKLETPEGIVRGMMFRGKDFIDIHTQQGTYRFGIVSGVGRRAQAHAPGSLCSPMPGKVLKVLVKVGDKVNAGETLMVLEAMKMEHKIVSPEAGEVEKIFFNEGDRVAQDVELVKICSS